VLGSPWVAKGSQSKAEDKAGTLGLAFLASTTARARAEEGQNIGNGF